VLPTGEPDGAATGFRVFDDMIDDSEAIRCKQPPILFRIEAGVIERVSPVCADALAMSGA
jgi:hypothetical protein